MADEKAAEKTEEKADKPEKKSAEKSEEKVDEPVLRKCSLPEDYKPGVQIINITYRGASAVFDRSKGNDPVEVMLNDEAAAAFAREGVEVNPPASDGKKKSSTESKKDNGGSEKDKK